MNDARERCRGFSFVEILIVMAIVGVLAGGVVVAINIWSRRGPEFRTENRVQALRMITNSWKTKFDRWPPATVKEIPNVAGVGKEVKKVPNTTNEGIEALYQALYWPGFGQDPQLEGEGSVVNTDDDRLDKAVNVRDSPELYEIVDGFGNPIVYIPHTAYGSTDAAPGIYINANGVDVRPKPYRSAQGGFVEPFGVQIYSMGADGEPNTADDIKAWGD
jgi:prepilin-type N-terminal cleavage/methylation domain-containing protein